MDNEEKLENKYAMIPVVPLRGLVVLPYSAMSFDVGRERSIAAINAAASNDGYVLLSAQKDPKKTDVEPDDICTVGCLCRVKSREKLEGGTLRVLVEGIVRARADSFLPFNNLEFGEYLTANITCLPADAPTDAEREAPFRTEIDEKCKKFAEMIGNAQLKTTLSFVGRSSDDVEYVFRTANIFLQKPEDRQRIMDAEDHTERSLALIGILSREFEVLELKKRIDEAVREAIDKNKRVFPPGADQSRAEGARRR